MKIIILILISLILLSGCSTRSIDKPITFVVDGDYNTLKECGDACNEKQKIENGCLMYATDFELIGNECKCKIAIECKGGF